MAPSEPSILVCCDGLKGFPEAIEAVFPQAIPTPSFHEAPQGFELTEFSPTALVVTTQPYVPWADFQEKYDEP